MTSPNLCLVTVELDHGTRKAIRALAQSAGLRVSPYLRQVTQAHVRSVPIGRRDIVVPFIVADEGGGP